MSKPTNQKLKLPGSPKPIPYSETQQKIIRAWERKEAYLEKFRADRQEGRFYA